MGERNRQVQDDMDLRVVKKLVHRRAVAAAVLSCQRFRAAVVDIRTGGNPEIAGKPLRVLQVNLADSPAADDADVKVKIFCHELDSDIRYLTIKEDEIDLCNF